MLVRLQRGRLHRWMSHVTLEEYKKLRDAEPELAKSAGDPCECDDRSWNTIGVGHLEGCANRGPHDKRRRVTPNQVAEAINRCMP